MAILPENLDFLSKEDQQRLEQWYSQRLYQRMLAQNPQHLLVQVEARFDLSDIERACQSYRHSSGAGVMATHRIRQLVRAALVKSLYHWSLRETEARINSDLILKWYVGYGVLEASMDHSTLARFAQWVNQHQHRIFFDAVLQQIDQAFPEEREAVQIGDTFSMAANAAREGWVELLRHLSRSLLRDLKQADPDGYPQVMQQIDEQALFGPARETHTYYLSAAEIQARFVRTVAAAMALAQVLQAHLPSQNAPPWAQIGQQVADLHQVLANNLAVQTDAGGQITQVTLLPVDKRGTYQMASATDREATIRNHGRDSTLGYNINLSITPRGFIREINAATGAQPDSVGIPELIEQQLRHLGTCPAKLIYDRAGGSGHTRARVETVSMGRTQLVARLPAPTYGDRFGPDHFTLSEDGQALTCPNQQTSTQGYNVADRYGRIFHFNSKNHCAGCPLWSQCRRPDQKPTANRSVFISDFRDTIRQALAYNQTDAFTRDMKLRPLVERIVFVLTHYDGARRAKGRGTLRADFQAKQAATARNIRTALRLWDRLGHPPSVFAK